MATAMLGSLIQGATLSAASVGTLVTLMNLVAWASLAAVDRQLRGSISVPPSTITLQGGRSVPASELQAGMVFLVRAGDGIPADGTVAKGKGTVDESRITGECMPVTKEKGSKVYSGAMLQSGFLEVTATSVVEASFQSKVMDSAQQAKYTQSRTQLTVAKFAAWYTPSVIAIAVLVHSEGL